MHEELRYFGDLNGFSGLPSALRHMIWNCQQLKVQDREAGLVPLFNFFRHGGKILDDILMDYIDSNPNLSVDTTKVVKKDIPTGSFNLFNSDSFDSRDGNKEKYLSGSTICVSVDINFLNFFLLEKNFLNCFVGNPTT